MEMFRLSNQDLTIVAGKLLQWLRQKCVKIHHPSHNESKNTGMSWVYKAPSKLITISLVYGGTIQSVDHGTLWLWRPKNSHSFGNSWISHSIYVSLLESITIFPANPFPISQINPNNSTPLRNHGLVGQFTHSWDHLRVPIEKGSTIVASPIPSPSHLHPVLASRAGRRHANSEASGNDCARQ